MKMHILTNIKAYSNLKKIVDQVNQLSKNQYDIYLEISPHNKKQKFRLERIGKNS